MELGAFITPLANVDSVTRQNPKFKALQTPLPTTSYECGSIMIHLYVDAKENLHTERDEMHSELAFEGLQRYLAHPGATNRN